MTNSRWITTQSWNEQSVARFANVTLDGNAVGFKVDTTTNLTGGGDVETRERRGIFAH